MFWSLRDQVLLTRHTSDTHWFDAGFDRTTMMTVFVMAIISYGTCFCLCSDSWPLVASVIIFWLCWFNFKLGPTRVRSFCFGFWIIFIATNIWTIRPQSCFAWLTMVVSAFWKACTHCAIQLYNGNPHKDKLWPTDAYRSTMTSSHQKDFLQNSLCLPNSYTIQFLIEFLIINLPFFFFFFTIIIIIIIIITPKKESQYSRLTNQQSIGTWIHDFNSLGF